jgi:hypothetical protein
MCKLGLDDARVTAMCLRFLPLGTINGVQRNLTGDHWQPVTLPTPAFHNLTFQIADDLDTIREHSAVPQAAG